MRFIKATYHASIKTAEYESENGTRLLKSGGTLNWRFNNPGNLISVKNQQGKIGVGVVYNPSKHSFAIFSSIVEGENAKRFLLKKKYKDYTIPEMMKKYAPGNDGNDPEAYANFIMSKSGVTKDEKVGGLNDDKFNQVMSAISKKEGGLKPGIEKWVYVTTVTVSDGTRPVADVAFQVTIGSTSYEWKTDEYGKLKAIIHTQPGMDIIIRYTNSSGKKDTLYSAIAGDETKNILLTRNFSQFAAKTLANAPKTSQEKSIQKPLEYTVMPGDSLSKIAKRYGTNTIEILSNNKIADVNKIFPGQRLTIYGVNPVSSSSQSMNTHPVKKGSINTSKQTLESLRGKKSGNPIALLPHDQREVPWMAVALGEAKKWKGADESIITKSSNYHDLIGYGRMLSNLVGSNHAWCASFVNYCLQEMGYTKSRYPYRARSFIADKNFFEILEPIYGAIATSGHHATFVYGKSRSSIIGLGGNQGGLTVINESVSAGTIKFSIYKGMRYYLPLAYKAYYKKTEKSILQEFDINELNSQLLGMIVKSKGKEGTR